VPRCGGACALGHYSAQKIFMNIHSCTRDQQNSIGSVLVLHIVLSNTTKKIDLNTAYVLRIQAYTSHPLLRYQWSDGGCYIGECIVMLQNVKR
jgi:hypothetical protein